MLIKIKFDKRSKDLYALKKVHSRERRFDLINWKNNLLQSKNRSKSIIFKVQ